MINLTLPKKYAKALFQAALQQGRLDEVKADIELMAASLKFNEDLFKIIKHPGISKAEKTSLVSKEYKKKASKLAVDFLCLLIDKKREEIFFAVVDIFAEKYDEHKGVKRLIIETAYPLSAKEKDKVAKSLEDRLKKKIRIDARVNEGMLGGIIIKDNMTQLDASINTYIENLKNELKSGGRVREVKKRTVKKKKKPDPVKKKIVPKKKKKKK